MEPEAVLVTNRVASALRALDVRHVIGGSLASSAYGYPRSTRDVDILAELRPEHVEPFVTALGEEFYVDLETVRDAVESGTSFNVIHQATMFKADIFVARTGPWTEQEMARARTEWLDLPDRRVLIRISSPEDTMLHKLLWYQLGGEVSDRQWSDVLGILRIQGDALDQAYLDRWATALGVAELLNRARQEA